MKLSIDIDCTPEEARRFLGLADVKAMQDKILKEIEERAIANIAAMDLDALMKTWFPAGFAGWEALQKAFLAQFGGEGRSDDGPAKKGG
ncbi:MAG: DUF6489 family protein [Alphaproteobacteria bacterium]